ncbi:hypothetical protein Ccrd_022825, partial [Cynara cardunculus var. scolymus]
TLAVDDNYSDLINRSWRNEHAVATEILRLDSAFVLRSREHILLKSLWIHTLPHKLKVPEPEDNDLSINYTSKRNDMVQAEDAAVVVGGGGGW